jgi:membrane protein involved in D-alanine export
VTPYADFTYFGLLLLYVVVPTMVLGFFGRAGWRWLLISTLLFLAVQLSGKLKLLGYAELREFWLFIGFGVWQVLLAFAYLRWRAKIPGWVPVFLGLLPLALVKLAPFVPMLSAIKFLGLSYITFRALDVLLSIKDGALKSLSLPAYVGLLFFFPPLSSGPIDRYRRFSQDFFKQRTRAEFFDDLDFAIARTFRGFLYKFIFAALIYVHWIQPLNQAKGALAFIGYMYAYTIYLFFDFAGYSAFAIGLSRLFGIHTPENFDRPFLARNVREFWNRWHITLSFWFRDHIYMRFLLAAAKGKWFKGKHTANYAGLFVTFGLMGVWHGLAWHYIFYGLYHAALLCGFDWFARWNKERKIWGDTLPWRAASVVLTFNAFAFGLLLFSGKLTH